MVIIQPYCLKANQENRDESIGNVMSDLINEEKDKGQTL